MMSPQLFMRGFQQNPFAIVITDLQGRIEYINHKFTQMTGLTLDEVRLSELCNPANYILNSSHEVLKQRKNGESYWEKMTVSPLIDETGVTTHYLWMSEDITTFKQKEEAEEFAKSALNALSAHIAILNAEGVIIAVNDAWRRFACENGGDENAVSEGVNYLDVLQVGDNDPDRYYTERFLTGLKSVMNNENQTFSLDYPCHSPDIERWFTVTVTRFMGKHHPHIVVAHKNVTERRKAENALQRTNSQLLLLNRIISFVSSTLNTDAILEVTCLELAHLLGVSQVMAFIFDEAMTTASVVAEYTSYNIISYLGNTFEIEDRQAFYELEDYRIPALSSTPEIAGLNRWLQQQSIEASLIAPLLVKRDLVGMIVVVGDHLLQEADTALLYSTTRAISHALENSFLHQEVEQKVEERTRQLSRANERMAAILNGTSDAILLLDENGLIETTNEAFTHIFGYQSDEASGNPVQMIAGDNSRLTAGLERIRVGQESKNLQITVYRKDGTTFDADVALARISDHQTHILCSVRDITHLKEVERMKDKFVSTVSHELRTPTTSIVLSASNLKSYYHRMSHEQRLASIDRLLAQSTLLAEMVEGILDISRIEVRQRLQNAAFCDLAEIAQNVINEFQTELRLKNLKLTFDIQPQYTMVQGEKMDFSRIWRNLISNAVKYTPDHRLISIRIGHLIVEPNGAVYLSSNLNKFTPPTGIEPGTYVVGQVADTGRGIPEDDLNGLFTRFYRGWASQSNIPGTGLGLALVRDLIQFYGGQINVHSQLNIGSVFSFCLLAESGVKS